MATLVSRITDLAATVRNKINAMVPRLLPVGGSVGQYLYKTGIADGAAGWTTVPTAKTATIIITEASLEWSETIADATLTGTETIMAWLLPTPDTDENCPEMTDLITLAASASLGSVTFDLSFSDPMSGPIKLGYKTQ